MPRVSTLYLDSRREQILDAAAACFARHGFHATTMQQICAAAALSPGAVYRYFPSKEAIVATLCERGFEQAAALIAEAQQHERFDDAVAALIDAFFSGPKPEDDCSNSLDLELWAEAARNPEMQALARRVLAGLRAPLAAIVRRAQTRGEVNPTIDAEAVAAAGVALFHGLVIQTVIDPALDVDGYARALRALLGGSFRAAQEDE